LKSRVGAAKLVNKNFQPPQGGTQNFFCLNLIVLLFGESSWAINSTIVDIYSNFYSFIFKIKNGRILGSIYRKFSKTGLLAFNQIVQSEKSEDTISYKKVFNLEIHFILDDERARGDQQLVAVVERHAESLPGFKIVQKIAVRVENADPHVLADVKPPLRIDRQILAAAVKLRFRQLVERPRTSAAEARQQLAVGREFEHRRISAFEQKEIARAVHRDLFDDFQTQIFAELYVFEFFKFRAQNRHAAAPRRDVKFAVQTERHVRSEIDALFAERFAGFPVQAINVVALQNEQIPFAVNRQRIEDEASLANGDEVQIGKFRLVYVAGPRTEEG